MIIPILYEKSFLGSIWCQKIQNNLSVCIAKKKHTATVIDSDDYRTYDYEALFTEETPRLVVLIATTPAWIEQAVTFFEQRSIGVILSEYDTSNSEAVVATVTFDCSDSFQKMLAHLEACGCTRPAFYGYFENSVSDHYKKECFFAEMQKRGVSAPERLCLQNTNGLGDCYAKLKEQISRFDSVICLNELAAFLLVKHCTADGIRIPEDLQIITLGDSKICEISAPPITTLYADHAILGQQIVQLYRYLATADCQALKATVLIKGEILQRESTRPLHTVAAPEPPKPTVAPEIELSVPQPPPRHAMLTNFYDDPEVSTYSDLERILLLCDPTDLQILKLFVTDVPYDAISDATYLSRGAIFYRLNQLEHLFGIESHRALKKFLIEKRFLSIL